MVALSEPVIALLGVALGGVLSAATAFASPWVASVLASRRFREELEWRRLDDLAALMDDAALALERFHWSLSNAIDGLDDGTNGSKRWRRIEAAVKDAQDRASSIGSRLAIRLGPRSESELVGVYDDFQLGYRNLAKAVFRQETESVHTGTLRQELDRWANHDRYFVAAKNKREQLGRQLTARA